MVKTEICSLKTYHLLFSCEVSSKGKINQSKLDSRADDFVALSQRFYCDGMTIQEKS